MSYCRSIRTSTLRFEVALPTHSSVSLQCLTHFSSFAPLRKWRNVAAVGIPAENAPDPCWRPLFFWRPSLKLNKLCDFTFRGYAGKIFKKSVFLEQNAQLFASTKVKFFAIVPHSNYDLAPSL